MQHSIDGWHRWMDEWVYRWVGGWMDSTDIMGGWMDG